MLSSNGVSVPLQYITLMGIFMLQQSDAKLNISESSKDHGDSTLFRGANEGNVGVK